MTLERQSDCRQLPVRLCDVKPLIRLRAAQKVAAREPQIAVDVFAAAVAPSRTTYWVQADALPILLRVAA